MSLLSMDDLNDRAINAILSWKSDRKYPEDMVAMLTEQLDFTETEDELKVAVTALYLWVVVGKRP